MEHGVQILFHIKAKNYQSFLFQAQDWNWTHDFFVKISTTLSKLCESPILKYTLKAFKN